MIESFILLLLFVIIGAAAYFYAEAKTKAALNTLQAERIRELKKENEGLWLKVLSKSGNTPLGWETRERRAEENPNPVVRPTIAHRGQLQERHQAKEEKTPTTDVPTINIDALKRQTVAKAEEIVNAVRE